MILDVGYGCGDQCLYWVHHYHVQHVEGINIAMEQVEFAQSHIKVHGLQDRIKLRYGSAIGKNNIIWRLEW